MLKWMAERTWIGSRLTASREDRFMSQGTLNAISIDCFVLWAILLFVAWERYDNNAMKVEAVNRLMQGSPFGGSHRSGT
jgi:hypothetical protein